LGWDGLPFPAIVVAEEKVVLSINSESLMSIRGHREDCEVAGKRTLGEEDVLPAIGRESVDGKCVGHGRGLRKI
jgi:hypothetical protein